MARFGIGLELGLARGERAEGLRRKIDRLLLVEVADQRELDRAVREAVADVLAQPGEVEREVGLLGLQRVARVVGRDDPAERVAERAFGRRGQAGEEVLDAAAVLGLPLRAVAGIADRGGEQLELQL